MKFKYRRRESHAVRVGSVMMGDQYPIVVQSMTTTPTEDTVLSCEQVMRITEAGGELVRLTAQGRSQAENLASIKNSLREQGCLVPLVADIHFTSSLAMIAARTVEKVRINPGNFVDKRANFSDLEFSQQQWDEEVAHLRSKFRELLSVCREHGTALRIGVNHGSLSDRIMSRYGNTPKGMVASAMEFLEVCLQDNFTDVVVSIKSSNVGVMVESYRLLSQTMQQAGMTFPLHLGVTEAGEGQQGRIRSGVGIGTLLGEGLGDTIRVSLTEPPENEIPAAQALAGYMSEDPLWNPQEITPTAGQYNYSTTLPLVIGGTQGDLSAQQCALWPRYTVDRVINGEAKPSDTPIIISSPYQGADWGQSIRHAVNILHGQGITAQTVVYKRYDENISLERLQIYAAADFGGLFVDKLVGGMWIEGLGDLSAISLDILQASRARISSAEIISCPGCGRTLYDLQTTVHRVKERFSHYKGLKLAVMGCIVNGPGEMADAEFGYVGSGPGLVTLYKGTQVVERNIPQDKALDKLEELIKQQWKK